MHQKTKFNRLLALLTSLLVLVSCFPTSVLAEAAADTETEQPSTEVTELSETAPSDETETISADETDTFADETPVEAEDNEEPPAVAEDAIPLVEPDGEAVEELPVDDLPADEQLLEELPADDLPADVQQTEELTAAEPDNPESVIAAYGHAYVVTVGTVEVYSDAELSELLFTVTQGNAALLATEYQILDGMGRVKVWLITEESEAVTGYVAEDALSSELLSDDEAGGMASVMRYGFVASEAGELLTFVVIGEKPNAPTDEPAIEETVLDVLIDEQAEETVPNVLMDEQAEETVAEPVIDPAAEPVTDDVQAESIEQPETAQELTESIEGEEAPALDFTPAQAGDFVSVTQQTRVYTAVDESIEDGYNGDLYDGVFVTDAAVQVESVTQDSLGRYWYAVRYQYGDDFADGTLKWTDYATVYVLASETAPGLEQGFTVTDYAFDAVPRARFALRSASPMNGFSLKSISVNIPTFYAGQSGLYGSSGKDSDYLQIAKSTEHGTIYATPHYLNGFSVYCLEHNLSGPGENISGGGQEPTGPYMVVDIDSYRNNPGYSSIIYHESTLHAIGWVLRHTYPFMALDRSDSDNLVWSRVAGQFAIREVIKQLEGAQYVRSYWDMDNFYRASGQAPAVYLEYARWLAANGIARASMTGNISVSGKSVSVSGSGYIGTVTLTTDADLMRISRSVGSLTGNTAGTDGSYYYLNSGDTVAVTSASNRFSIAVESVSSADEEANFLVGVPSVEIQKVLIPQYGAPYKLKSVSVPFEAPLGSISVIKKDAATGAALSGATFELFNGAGSVLQTQATGANGTATFSNLQPGSYIVREKSAPQGYTVSVSNTQNTTVTAGNVSTLTFANDTMTGKIRIIKTDKQTKEPLAGAKFTITRLSAPAGRSGTSQIVATITTDANGVAETGWLDWGKYKVEETTVPLHYADNHFSTTIEAYENGKTYTIEVENEPTKGWIRLVKTDDLDDTSIAGVQFDIYYNDEYGSGLAGSMTTDATGVAVSPALRKGQYIVREHENPTGYVTELVELDATIHSDGTTELSTTNRPIQGKIRITKRDELTQELLAGAEFTITRVSGLPSHNGSDNGEVAAIIVTDAYGVAESPLLTWGTYRVEETVVPTHFVDNAFSAEIVIDSEDQQIYKIDVENEPSKGWIRLVKTDDLDDTPIAGVQFDIYYNDEYGSGLAGSMTTDATGVAVSPALRKGRYIVREHENPTGYVTELVELDATVRSDETTELSATNQPIQGKIRITKRDELTQELLAGAEFTITRVSGLPSHNGSDNGEVVAVIVTDAYGVAESQLLTWGTYRVEETVVPTHFVDNAFSAEVVIDSEDQRIYKIDVENEPTKGWIRLVKTDRQNGNPIEGVQFDIYYNDEYGEGLATSMVTGADGIAVSEPLRKGRYIVREHGETAGYVFEEIALDATVKSDETTELCATNCHVTVQLKLYKRDAEAYEGDNPNASAKAKAVKQLPEPVQIDMPSTRGDGVLTGAVFQVLAGADVQDRQGNMVYAKGAVVVEALLTAGDDASVTTDELWPGLYEIVELTPPVGYAASDTHFYVDARSAAYQSQEAVVTYEGLKTNTILYGAFGFVKFMGDNTVHSDAGIIETPEKGAEFEVYLKSVGSYENARSFERDYLKTNKYGKAQTKALPYGVYVLRQVVGAEGYAIMRPIDIMIDGTESLKDPPTLILNNEAIHYRLRIVKLDAETGKPVLLANTAFKLKDADGNDIKQSVNYPAPTEMDTFLTNENGEVTLPEPVTWGQYFIEEVQSPEGYLRSTEDIEVFVGHTGDTADEVYEVTVEVPDTPVKGCIAVEKKGLLLTGVETLTDAYGNEVQRPVYEEGYLAGAVFEVRAVETILGKDGTVWYEQDALVDTVVTSSEGPDKSKTLPLGKYYLLETETPEGYASENTRYDVELAFADRMTAVVEVTVRVTNDYLPVEVSLTKEADVISTITKDDGVVTATITNEKGEGFVFGLFNASDIHCGDAFLMADTLVATGMTDANGALTFSGCYPHGEYYIRELSAPAGWKLNPMSFAVSLTAEAANENVIRVALPEAVHDELIYATVTLTKKDITGENTLPGTQIEVRNSRNAIIYRAYTDENGQIPDIPVTPGTYTFREVLAPEGYSLNEAVMTFAVDEHGGVMGDTVIRDDYTRFSLLKQDENGKPLPGVTFGLKKADGTQVATAVSDANGLVVFEKIPYGSYTIMETKSLSRYVRSDTKIQVTIDGTFVNPTAPLATIVNQRIHVHGVKVDTSGRFLEGAEFSLIKADTGEVVETVTSNEKGGFVLSRFDDGSWMIRETKAPAGFLPMQDITLHVDESWTEPAVFTCVNIPDHYAFVKTDHEGNPLSGVRFVLEDENGNVLRELTSGADGVVQLDDLTLGGYVIRETEALEGYQKTEETLSFTIDENYIVADEMPRLINYAEGEVIQTGFEMEMTPVMWTGAAMMLTGIVLAIGYGAMRKGKKRHQ